MKHLSILFLPALLLVVALSSKASPSNGVGVSYSLPHDSTQLVIRLEDKVEVANACDYHIQRFEFISSLNALLIDLGTEPCHVDRIGKRKAEMIWTLPQSLRQMGKLCVVVNGQKMGMFFYDRAQADYVIGQTEFCE